MKQHITLSQSQRLYYLDWLRVMAFSVLLFEHVAEVFVSWHFWAKNAETSDALSYFIAFFKPWRMPLLFFISGAAVTLSFKRRSPVTLVKERTVRILLPLLAAMFLVIPPQIYFIKLSAGSNEPFHEFYRQVLTLKWFPKGNFHWLHLWYLAFIFGYTLLMLPILQKLKSDRGKALLTRMACFVSRPVCLFSLALVFVVPYYLTSLCFQNENAGQLAFYFPFFVFGSLLGTHHLIQQAIRKYSGTALFLAAVITTVFYFLAGFNNNMQFDYFFNISAIHSLPVLLLKAFNQWLWVIAVLGLGMKFIRTGSSALNYATQAVYPFYILHQTVIVIIAWFVIPLEYSITVKLLLILIPSFLLIFLMYEFVIRRTIITRLLFGLKVPPLVAKKPVTEWQSRETPEPQVVPVFNELRAVPPEQ